MSQEDLELVKGLLGPFEQGEIIPLFLDEETSAALTAASALSSRRTSSAYSYATTSDALPTGGSTGWWQRGATGSSAP